MSLEKSQHGIPVIKAFNPETRDLSYEFRPSQVKLNNIRKFGNSCEKNRAIHLVIPTLQEPSAVFRGLRLEEDSRLSGEESGWLCYCSRPWRDFDRLGKECNPPPNRVFLVFVNSEHVFYDWRWEDADLQEVIANKIYLPENHQTRFKERLLW